MKAMTKPLALMCVLVAILGMGRTGGAAPVQAKNLPADAKWYLHLDFDAMKNTAIYGQILDAVRLEYPIDDFLPQLKEAIGINPLTDISGVTVFNNSFEKDVAAVLVYAQFDKDRLLNAVAQNPEYAAVDYKKHTIQTWTDPNDSKSKAGCVYDDGLILMGNGKESIKMAIDALDAKKDTGPALVKEAPKGAFLYAAADLAQSNDANVSQLLSNSQAATAAIGEVDGKMSVKVNLTAKTADQGAKLKQMLDGIKAFGELGARETPTAVDLIREVQVSVDGAKVMISIQHDAKTLVETLKKLDAENKAKAAKAAGAQK